MSYLLWLKITSGINDFFLIISTNIPIQKLFGLIICFGLKKVFEDAFTKFLCDSISFTIYNIEAKWSPCFAVCGDILIPVDKASRGLKMMKH